MKTLKIDFEFVANLYSSVLELAFTYHVKVRENIQILVGSTRKINKK